MSKKRPRRPGTKTGLDERIALLTEQKGRWRALVRRLREEAAVHEGLSVLSDSEIRFLAERSSSELEKRVAQTVRDERAKEAQRQEQQEQQRRQDELDREERQKKEERRKEERQKRITEEARRREQRERLLRMSDEELTRISAGPRESLVHALAAQILRERRVQITREEAERKKQEEELRKIDEQHRRDLYWSMSVTELKQFMQAGECDRSLAEVVLRAKQCKLLRGMHISKLQALLMQGIDGWPTELIEEALSRREQVPPTGSQQRKRRGTTPSGGAMPWDDAVGPDPWRTHGG